MIYKNTQKILKKKWKIEGKIGEVKIKRLILERRFCQDNNVRYFAFFVYESLGKKFWRYLGQCDYLGRPK